MAEGSTAPETQNPTPSPAAAGSPDNPAGSRTPPSVEQLQTGQVEAKDFLADLIAGVAAKHAPELNVDPQQIAENMYTPFGIEPGALPQTGTQTEPSGGVAQEVNLEHPFGAEAAEGKLPMVTIGPEKVVGLMRVEPIEWVRVRTANAETDIPLPKSDEGKIAWMRDILNQIEQTRFPDGGPGLNRRLDVVTWVLSSLTDANMRGSSPDRIRLGIEMLKEARARLALHQIYLKVTSTENMEEIRNAVAELSGESLNFFFVQTPAVWKSFLDYDQRSDEFLGARGAEEDSFRQSVRTKAEAWEGVSAITQAEYKRVAAESMQRMGERMFIIGARAAGRDRLVHKTLRTIIKPDDEKDSNPDFAAGNADFLDAAGKVNEGFLRLLKLKAYTLFKKKAWNIPDADLVDVNGGILDSKDYYAEIPDKIEGYFETLIFDRRERETRALAGGRELTTQEAIDARRYARDRARQLAQRVIGLTKEEDINRDTGRIARFDDGTDQEKYKWPKDADGLIDISKIKWRAIDRDATLNADLTRELGLTVPPRTRGLGLTVLDLDFNILYGGKAPMVGWATVNLMLPDNTRDALIGGDGYIRNPSIEERLVKVLKLLTPDSGKRDKVTLKHIEFASKKMRRLLGKDNLSKTGAEALINKLAGITDPNGVALLKPQDRDREKMIDKAMEYYKSFPEKLWDIVKAPVVLPYKAGNFLYELATDAKKRETAWEDFKLSIKRLPRRPYFKFILFFLLSLFNPFAWMSEIGKRSVSNK